MSLAGYTQVSQIPREDDHGLAFNSSCACIRHSGFSDSRRIEEPAAGRRAAFTRKKERRT